MDIDRVINTDDPRAHLTENQLLGMIEFLLGPDRVMWIVRDYTAQQVIPDRVQFVGGEAARVEALGGHWILGEDIFETEVGAIQHAQSLVSEQLRPLIAAANRLIRRERYLLRGEGTHELGV
jgi:hypothetical protein